MKSSKQRLYQSLTLVEFIHTFLCVGRGAETVSCLPKVQYVERVNAFSVIEVPRIVSYNQQYNNNQCNSLIVTLLQCYQYSIFNV